MIATVAAPQTSVSPHLLPAGACDCHTHLFGPFGSFPPLREPVYPLPDADPTIHAEMRAKLGVARGVLVQPAPYGSDPSAMINAVSNAHGGLRAVAVADDGITAETLADWHRKGVRGLRFVEMRAHDGRRYPGSVGLDVLEKLAPAMAEVGLHANLWFPFDLLCEKLPVLAKLGVPLVIDHMGMVDAGSTPRDEKVGRFAAHLAEYDIWLKLVLCRVERADLTGGANIRRLHDLFVQTRPERMLWGSDWPYVRLDPEPDAATMLDLFMQWVDDADLRKAILTLNPETLYGFEKETR